MELGPSDGRSDAVGARSGERLASAARRASLRGDHVAAANLLQRAVNLWPSGGAKRAGMLYDLGDALAWVGEAQSALAAFEEATSCAADAKDRSLEWLARIRRSATKMLTDPHGMPTEEFRAELEEAARAFEELGDDAALATVWTELAFIEWMPCRFDLAVRAGERALEHARRSGDKRLLDKALVPFIAGQMFGPTTPAEGLRTLDELSDDLSDSRLHASVVLGVRGFYAGLEGSFDEARHLIALGDEVAESIGARFILSAHAEHLGGLELSAGDAEAAERAFRRNYEGLEALGDEGHLSYAAGGLARSLFELGRFDEAERYVEIGLRLAAEDDLASQTMARSARALVLAERSEFAEAESLAREAVRLYADAQCPTFQGNAWLDLARVLRVVGKPAEAKEAAVEALAFYERKGNRPASATARAFIDEIGLSPR
jgi:tetratricopeptide (TPR) repeat protein